MSERERDILEAVAEALPKMDELSKGYFLGYAEAMAASKKDEENEDGKDQG